MKKLLEQKIDASNPKVWYCSMTAVMLGIVEPKLLKTGGDSTEEQKRYATYFEQMQAVLRKAEEIEKHE